MIKNRIKSIIEDLKSGLIERDREVKLSVLGALSGENIFLYGPPGVAKSLISRRLAEIFENSSYFEYLMQKFSTPEEVFGPISIRELKNDNFIRKIDSYLPTAEVAFLDEIFKASPAILNTLLTIINEKIYKNGKEVKKVPLKVLISASNEIPKDLEALYDRFLIRLIVNPIGNKDNLKIMLNSTPSKIEIKEKIKDEEWQKWQEEINKVKLSDDVFELIYAIKLALNKKEIYISDRRLQKAVRLLKASAFFNDREETNRIDINLLKFCLWEKEEDFEVVKEIVENIIKNSGVDSGVNILKVKKEKGEFEKELDNIVYYEDCIYEDTIKLGNDYYFKFNIDEPMYENLSTIYIPVDILNSSNKKVLDKNKQKTDKIKINVESKKIITIEYPRFINNNFFDIELEELLFEGEQEKGMRKKGIRKIIQPTLKKGFIKQVDNIKGFFRNGKVHDRLKETLIEDTNELKNKLLNALQNAKKSKENLIQNLTNIFLEDEEIKLAMNGVNKQIDDLEFELKDLERIYNKIKG